MGVAPPSEELSPSSGSRRTLVIGVAQPPMPKLDPLPIAPVAAAPAPPPPEPVSKEPSSKFPTLMMFDGEDHHDHAPVQSSEEAPAIVVPPPEPSKVTNAVTRPPPWGEGATETQIPKSPPVP